MPQRKPHDEEIVAVGAGGRDEGGKLTPLDVHGGDRVVFAKWSGTEIKLAGQELLIMKEADVIGILDKAECKQKAA